MVETIRRGTIVAAARSPGIALVCLHVRQPYDVAVHVTLAYAESYSSDIARSLYRLRSCEHVEIRLIIIALASVR